MQTIWIRSLTHCGFRLAMYVGIRHFLVNSACTVRLEQEDILKQQDGLYQNMTINSPNIEYFI
jgi:hypothetical protein